MNKHKITENGEGKDSHQNRASDTVLSVGKKVIHTVVIGNTGGKVVDTTSFAKEIVTQIALPWDSRAPGSMKGVSSEKRAKNIQNIFSGSVREGDILELNFSPDSGSESVSLLITVKEVAKSHLKGSLYIIGLKEDVYLNTIMLELPVKKEGKRGLKFFNGKKRYSFEDPLLTKGIHESELRNITVFRDPVLYSLLSRVTEIVSKILPKGK